MAKGNVFISYRREDTSGQAGRIYDRLNSRLSGRVFMDVAGIEPGVDFVEAIEREVSACEVLLVLIGRRWLDSLDESGKKRIFNPDDYVRLEVAAALKRNIRVIPVLLDRASMPGAPDLPSDLQPLVRRNAIEIGHADFDSDMPRLELAVERALDKGPDVRTPGGTRAVKNARIWALVGVSLLTVAGVVIWTTWHRDRASNSTQGVKKGDPKGQTEQTKTPGTKIVDKATEDKGEPPDGPDPGARALLLKIANEKKDSVFVIRQSGTRALAAGFILGENTLLTADYVAKMGSALSAVGAGGEVALSLINVDQHSGLSAYRFGAGATGAAQRLVYARELPAVGEPVQAIGATPEGTLAFAFGRVRGHDTRSIHVAFARPEMAGFGGGPVLNRNGRVVGVIHSGSRPQSGERIHHCIRAEVAVTFLRGLR